MKAVLGLGQRKGCLPIKDVAGDLLATVGWEAVHDKTVLSRLPQQCLVHLVGFENVRDPGALLSRFGPDVRVHHIRIADGLCRFTNELHTIRRFRLRLLQDLRVRFVARRTTKRKVKRKFFGDFQPGVCNVVSIADEENLCGRAEATGLFQRQHIGKDLAGMQQVGHGIDDRHTRTFSELDAGLVATGPGDDEIVVARENDSPIGVRSYNTLLLFLAQSAKRDVDQACGQHDEPPCG